LSRQVIWRVAVNNAWPLVSATATSVVDEDGSLQRSLGRTSSRRSYNASVTLKF
jgi:hypothetical protein